MDTSTAPDSSLNREESMYGFLELCLYRSCSPHNACIRLVNYAILADISQSPFFLQLGSKFDGPLLIVHKN